MAEDDRRSPSDSHDDAKPREGDKQNEPKKKAPISFGGAAPSGDAWNVVPPPPSSPANPPSPDTDPLTGHQGKAPLSSQPAAESPPPKVETQLPAEAKKKLESHKKGQAPTSRPQGRTKGAAKAEQRTSKPATTRKPSPAKQSATEPAAPSARAKTQREAKQAGTKSDERSAEVSSAKQAEDMPNTSGALKEKQKKDDSPSESAAPAEAPAAEPLSKQKLPTPAHFNKLPDFVPKREQAVAPEDDGAGPIVVAEEELPWYQQLRGYAIHETPPWMVSLVAHFVLVILLALFTVVTYHEEPQVIEATYAEQLGEQLEYDMQILDMKDYEIDANSGALESFTEIADLPLPNSLTEIDLVGSEAARLDEVEVPGTELMARGEGATKRALLKAYGGNATTEQSVAAALEWLKRNQLKDGSWSLKEPYSDGATVENKISATAMALLAFQGAGHTDRTGDHAKVVARGWRYLLGQLDASGSFLERGTLISQHRPYTQAQATIALCELYAMTNDPELKPKAQAAIDYSVEWQAREGGWRYQPRVESDLSVTGWFLMALQSARMGGLEVPEETLENVDRFLETVASLPQGGASFPPGSRYQYRDQRAENFTPTMTAEGLLCRQYRGWSQDDPRLKNGMEYILNNPIQWERPNVYYWYYATQVAHHMEGEQWRRWNQELRQIVPEHQVQGGREKGSWDPAYDEYGVKAGRLFMTCLCTYMLEVYYRHLPIYSKHQIVGQ